MIADVDCDGWMRSLESDEVGDEFANVGHD